MKTMFLIALALSLIPGGKSFLEPLEPRDSALVADQFEYGVRLDSLRSGTALGFADFSPLSGDTLVLVRGWKLDTVSVRGRSTKKADPREFDVRASVLLAPFEQGVYELPPIAVARMTPEGMVDTLLFEPCTLEVYEVPVDTASFEVRDLKAQINYPVTLAEVLPWVGGGLALAAGVAALVWFLRRRSRRKQEALHRDPPHIIALRELDRYRSDKYWAPEKQKAFYSGITDALKNYIDARFGVDAPEMTTAELFAALKSDKDLTPELYSDLKDLFERADFVKFAKFTASDTENAAALPLAVRFVTSTYQAEIEGGEEAAGKDVL